MRAPYLNFLIAMCIMLSCNSSNSQSTLQERADHAYHADEYQKAFVLYDSLIKLDSTKGEFYFRRGRCNSLIKTDVSFNNLEELEKLERAKKENSQRTINDYLKAASLNYEKHKTYLNLGVIYTFVDDNIALSYFEKSLKENPNYEKAKYEIELCKKRIETNTHFY